MRSWRLVGKDQPILDQAPASAPISRPWAVCRKVGLLVVPIFLLSQALSLLPIHASEPDATLAQKVVLYDEDPSDPNGRKYEGSVNWQSVPVKVRAGQPDDIAVQADVEIPERRLKLTLVLRRNFDAALPASHVAELTFTVPAGFAGVGIGKVPGLLMKSSEVARAAPLKGLSVKVVDNLFLIGLSNAPQDRAYNLALLQGNGWLDVPIVYSNERRAILAIEKGTSGSAIFQAAFAAWGRSP